MSIFIEQIVSGIGIGAIYALVALGFVLIYKATEVVNFATGDIMMLGPFILYTLFVILKIPLYLGIIISLLCLAAFGAGIDRFILRRLLGEPMMAVILATLAVGLIVRSLVGIVWGFDVLPMSGFIPDYAVSVGGIAVSSVYLIALLVFLSLIGILYMFFQHTKTGIAMQATAQNQFSSYLMGIDVGRIFSLTWAISGVTCAIAGMLLVPIAGLNIHMTHIGMMAFPAAILGGLASIPGAIIGGIIIGVTESLSGYYVPIVKDSLAFAILLFVLLIKPEGVFGKAERKKI